VGAPGRPVGRARPVHLEHSERFPCRETGTKGLFGGSRLAEERQRERRECRVGTLKNWTFDVAAATSSRLLYGNWSATVGVSHGFHL